MGGNDSLVNTTTSCCGQAGGGAGFDHARIDVGLDRVERMNDTRRGF